MYPNLLKKKKKKNLRSISNKLQDGLKKSYMKDCDLNMKLPVI